MFVPFSTSRRQSSGWLVVIGWRLPAPYAMRVKLSPPPLLRLPLLRRSPLLW